MKVPNTVLDTKCPNDCGLVTAAARAFLTKHGIKNKGLFVQFNKTEGHSLVLFKSGETFILYDREGCLNCLHVTWRTKADILGKLWLGRAYPIAKFNKAKWF